MTARAPQPFVARTAAIALALLLGACGGGGGAGEEDDEPDAGPVGPGWSTPPATPGLPGPGAVVSGVFRDSSVNGLDFESGGQRGRTAADGVFSYEHNTTVSFRIGVFEFGSGTGQPFMSPLNLPVGATDLVRQVQNRSRFLQMLDRDQDPGNGIEISAAVRASAASWPQVDFTTADLASEVGTIIQQATAADGVTHALPSATDADAHFARTFRCTYSGLYRGTYSGAAMGVFATVIHGAGEQDGFAYSSIERDGALLESRSSLLLTIFPRFAAAAVGNGPSFSGRLDLPTTMSGTWANGADNGTFTGSRVPLAARPVHRIAGFVFPLGTKLIMAFEIDAQDRVTGAVIDLDRLGTGEPVAVQGTLNGTAFEARSATTGYVVTGTFDRSAAPAALRLVGSITDQRKSRTANIQAMPACRLSG